MRERIPRLIPWLVAVAWSAVGAAPAAALMPPGTSLRTDGPVARFGTSEQFHCHTWRDGDREGVFFGETACGTLVATDEGLFVPDDMPGANPLDDVAVPFTPVAQSSGGTGGPRDPYAVTTVAMAGSGVRVEQTDTYRRGDSAVVTRIEVANVGAAARSLTVFRAADCYAAGDDDGFGSLAPGSATCVSGGTPRLIGLRDLGGGATPWEGDSQAMWGLVAATVPGGDPLGRRCACGSRIDNAVALTWTLRLGSGERRTLRTSIDVGASLPPGPLGVRENGILGMPDSLPYAALGDSYSSGEGAGNHNRPFEYRYLPGSNIRANRCHRSRNAYPFMVSRSLGLDPETELAFRACSGATISNITTDRGGAGAAEPPQVAALGPETRLVTLTIGGNDAGFARIVESCLTPAACDTAKEAEADAAYDRLADRVSESGLAAAYRAIAARRRPSTPVMVLGYPDFVPYFPTCSSFVYVEDAERQWLSLQILQVNGLIAKRARQAGFRFVDVGPEYRRWNSPHRVCQGDEFVNGLRGMPVASESLHPNRFGHRAFARHVLTQPEFLRTPRGRIRAAELVPPDGDAREVVVTPATPRRVEVNVPPGSDTFVVVGTGHGPVRVGLVNAAGRPVVTRPDAPRNLGATPGAFRTDDPGIGTSFTLYRVPGGTYGVDLGLPPDAAPAYVTVTVTSDPHVNRPPVAVASGWVDRRGRLHADAGSSGDPESRSAPRAEWAFGDGTRAGGVTAAHRYRRPGRYAATLTVTDAEGATGRRTLVVDTTRRAFFRVTGRRAGRRLTLTVWCTPTAVGRCAGTITVAGRRPVSVAVARGSRARLAVAGVRPNVAVRARLIDGAVRRPGLATWRGRW